MAKGIFDRLSRLLRANVHSAIDKAEDPEKMLDQLIREAEEGRDAGQQKLLTAVAERNRIAAEAASEEKTALRAMNQAEAALRKGQDDLAREALRRRHDALEAAEVYNQQAAAHQLMVERLKVQLTRVDTKLGRMHHERTMLVARSRMADAQLTIAGASKQFNMQEIDGEFARFTRRVRHEEALAGAAFELQDESLEGRIDALEDEEIEAQLVTLRERLQGDAGMLINHELSAIGERTSVAAIDNR